MVRSIGKFLKNSSAACVVFDLWHNTASLLIVFLLGSAAVADETLLLENQASVPISGFADTAEVERLTSEAAEILDGTQGKVTVQFVANVDTPGRGRYYLQLSQPLSSGGKMSLQAKRQEPLRDVVTVERREDQLVIRVGEQELLRYHLALLPSPNPDQPEYGRSGFMHPVRTPLGTIVTDDFPPDHMHQHGVMFAWTDTTYSGRHVDFWNSFKQEGRVEHRRLLRTFSGPVVGGFDVELAHVDLTSGEPIDVLYETWSVRAYASADPFLLEIESVQRAAGAEPLVIRKYHYGGMAVRGSREWYQAKEAGFLTSEGKDRLAGNHSRPRWVDMFGPADKGKLAGIAVLDSPDNFRFPQPVRLHPDKPYFCFSPQVEDAFTIGPESTYRSRYWLVPHDGPIQQEQIEAIWNSFAHPLTLKKES
ncbi:PmoA family protein [Blastopirellula sp. JC732]|uniref:PmoA family protein n=1 Tax=Blastopirellula sediminis TaxID=2894196 RepID=A0A9X1SI07_9BACT|nr:PmoA family protein [Blastopirellula sediminis]MCC9606331.1 PmoA family protein [Blastopirellula sediminis]MCC9630371.1 PmoA family protein [Blastopirellula sediminis]